MSMTFIAHIEVTDPSGQAALEFTVIPQTYTDLLIVLSGRTTRGAINDYVGISFNANTSNYTARFLYGSGSSTATSYTDSIAPRYGAETNAATSPANTFGNSQIYIPNYRSSNAKSFGGNSVTENNATGVSMTISAGLWNDINAITSIKLQGLASGANTWVQYTTATLYGITAGSDGTTTVS